MVVVSRLRKDAALWSVPSAAAAGGAKKRGPRPTYGKQALSLAKRAAHRGGWQAGEFVLYGATVAKTFKTFLATYTPAGGLIRVVLVREVDGWVAFFCTDPQATVAQILEAVADRAVIEQDFHDLKEVHGAGQQQVRRYWANVAVYHLNLWLHTLIELWAWTKSQARLCDRTRAPGTTPSGGLRMRIGGTPYAGCACKTKSETLAAAGRWRGDYGRSAAVCSSWRLGVRAFLGKCRFYLTINQFNHQRIVKREITPGTMTELHRLISRGVNVRRVLLNGQIGSP